jgi:hypothetical protein
MLVALVLIELVPNKTSLLNQPDDDPGDSSHEDIVARCSRHPTPPADSTGSKVQGGEPKVFALVEPNEPARQRSLPTQYLAKRTSIVCSLEQTAAGSFAAPRVRRQYPRGQCRLDHRQVGYGVAISY